MTTWILREGKARGTFRYVSPQGRPLTDARRLARIDALRIPPAWRDVHIAASPSSAVQAWGIDAKGRKQYRYHGRAVEIGETRKYYRMRRLARDLPTIRERLAADSARGDFSLESVAATVVQLLSEGFFRIGSERYAKENRTFGIATLRKSHVRVAGDTVFFDYVGKRSIAHRRAVVEPQVALGITRLLETPGPRLFRYRLGRTWRDITAADVNEYIRQIAGRRYSAKDFRTWGGTLRMATVLAELGPAPKTPRLRHKMVVTALRFVAAELGNTPAICRKAYIHPMVIARFEDEGETIASSLAQMPRGRQPNGHQSEEKALIRFLDKHFPERRRRPRSEDLVFPRGDSD
ncbi:MAG: DNA topoisomerase IB [Gemmatimonadota bacterium]|nr:DNA topoisomerase IB [Gemmatimonadota bacterium]